MPRRRELRVGWRWIGLLSLLALGIADCSGGRRNSEVASDVQNRIRGDARMQMARVQVLVTNGVVTLSGYVTSNEQRVATVEDVGQIKGVRVVIDNMRIVDPKPQDTAVAMQKPSAAVARSAPPPASHPASPIILKAASPRTTKAAAAEDRPSVAQTVAVASPPAPATSPTAGPVTATPERHAVPTEAPAVGATVAAASVFGVSPSARPVPPAEPERVTVPNGTELVVRLTESVSSDLNEKGDTFLASLASPIRIGDRVVIPAEAGVEGKVVDVESAGRFSGRPKLAVQMTRLTYNGKTYELRSSQYSKQGASRDARTVAAIGGGAGVGAIIGAVLGGGRGAAIGSVIGAGVGTGAQAAGKAPQVNLPAETVLSFRLQAPLTVMPSSTLQRAQNSGPGSPQDPFSSDDDRPVLKRRPGSPPPEADAPEGTPHSDNK
jgi:hypothetical protein